MHLQRILIYCLSFVVLLANANNLHKKEIVIKEPKVPTESLRIGQPKQTAQADSPFMPVFLTTSNVKASDFTQEMLKSLATNSYIKPSVKLSTNKSTNVSNNHKQAARSSPVSHQESSNKKSDKTIKSETVVTRWSKAGSTSNFSPVLPINLSSKMQFDTTGFIPIVPKQTTTATRSSSNAKLIKQASKPISRPLVVSRTVPLPKSHQLAVVQSLAKNTSAKRKTLIGLNSSNKLINKETNVLPNPSVRALKAIKANIIKSNAKPPASKPLAAKQISSKSTNAKHVDNRPIAASSTESSSYLAGQLNSRDARKALLKMNTLRYLAKLSPQWAASSLSETYQSKVGGSSLKAYPIGKITVPAEQESYGGGSYGSKKPGISIELIKEILHKLTNDEVQFNKLYVMGTHRHKDQNGMNNDQQYDQPNSGGNQDDSAYNNQENNDAGYQQNGASYQDQNSNGEYQQGGYNQPDNGGYSQPDYSQGGNSYDQGGNSYDQGGNSYDQGSNSYDQGGNSYDQGGTSYGGNSNGDSYSNEGGNSYSNDGNSYGSNEGGGNSYNSNEGAPYNTPENGNAYQNGGSDEEQGYHLQSLDMSEYTNRAYVPSYSLNHLASFVHSRFKEIAMKKQMGEYQFTDNPYLNDYSNYKSMMDVNYHQMVPDGQPGMSNGGRKKKCNKNHQHNQNGGAGYAPNNDVNFDDSYNNYGMKSMVPLVYYNNNG